MIIDLRTIPNGPRNYEFSLDEDWWTSHEDDDHVMAFDTPLQVMIKIYKAGDKYVLEGELSGGLRVRCDRCLGPFHRDLRSPFQVFLALPLPEAGQTEIELLEEDMEVDFLRGEEIELEKIIREQIFLALPIKSLCKKNCLGLCPICGTNLNREKCHCQQHHGHPAFSKLKQLKIEGD